MFPISGCIFRRFENSEEFLVADFALQILQIFSQVFPESLQLSQEILTILLKLLPDGGALFWRSGSELNQQSPLSRKVLIARRIKTHDQGLDGIGRILQIANQVAIIPIRRHDHRRWCGGSGVISQQRTSAEEANARRAGYEECS